MLSRGANIMAIISRNLWSSLLQVLGQLLVPKQQKREGGGNKGPKKILVFKNALLGLLFLQKSQQGWRELESI